MIDIFAWIVLLILVASAIAIFFIAGSLPGHIAKSRDPARPWRQAGHGGTLRRAGQTGRRQARSQPPGRRCGDYPPHIKPAHVIRKVILRQIAILNYVNPF
jgi:hypothetical protein